MLPSDAPTVPGVKGKTGLREQEFRVITVQFGKSGFNLIPACTSQESFCHKTYRDNCDQHTKYQHCTVTKQLKQSTNERMNFITPDENNVMVYL